MMTTTGVLVPTDPSTPDGPPVTARVDGPTDRSPRRGADGAAVTQRRVLRAEWIKLVSVRSTVVGLVAALVVAVGLGLILSAAAGSGSTVPGPPGDPAGGLGSDSVSLSIAGFTLAQLIVGVLGVLSVTSEYATGLIRTTFSAVTRRLPVLQAKAMVFGGVALAVMLVAALLAFFGGQAVYSGTAATAAITDPDVARTVLGTAFSTAGIGVMGVALGFLLRSAAAAIGVLFGGLLLVPTIVGLIPGSLSDAITKVLPSSAGSAFTSVTSSTDLLSAGMGFAVFVAWVVGLLTLAAVVVRRRDA